MLILCAIVGGLLCLTCFLFLVVHPLVCIFECALSKTLSGSQKATWIVVAFFTGVFGSLAYALFASGSTRLRSLTLTGMKLGTVNLLLAIGAFAATPEVRDFISNPFGDLSYESLAIETTVESTMEGSDLESVPAEDTNDSQTVPGEQYVAIVTDTLEAQNDAAAEENAALFAMLAEERDIAPSESETAELVPAPVQAAIDQAAIVEPKPIQQPALSTSEPDPSLSIFDSTSATENEVGWGNLVEPSIEIDGLADTTLLTDLDDNAQMLESINNAEVMPELAVGTIESENKVANTLEAESTADDTPEPENAIGDIFQSQSNKSNSPIVFAPVEATISALVPAEAPKASLESSQPQTRTSQPVTLNKPEKTTKKNRINRYRVEGYPVYEVTVSPTPTVRNRYTSQ